MNLIGVTWLAGSHLPSGCRCTSHHGLQEWRNTPAGQALILLLRSDAAPQRSSGVGMHHSHQALLEPVHPPEPAMITQLASGQHNQHCLCLLDLNAYLHADMRMQTSGIDGAVGVKDGL